MSHAERPSHAVQVAVKPGLPDPEADHALAVLREAFSALGHPAEAVVSVRFVRAFLIDGLDRDGAARAAGEVLADAITETWSVDGLPVDLGSDVVVSVLRRPGVMDPSENSCLRALAAAGLPAEGVRTARRFLVRCADGTEADSVPAAVRRALANEVIEELHTEVELDTRVPHPAPYVFRRIEVPVREASDADLVRVSQEMTLSLTLVEMQAIQAFFREIGREPTDVELETLAQTWSEHCKHKTLGGNVTFRDADGSTRHYDNLLKETVFDSTKQLAREDCLSVFVDNAVIAFDDEHGVCMKVETHNHPSAIEPYGGAGTGIGGVIRDILGTGLGARPFLNTDVFCFAPPDTAIEDVPAGCLHPRRIMHGVVSGVRDYGNRMGIPTASGGLFFDPRYVGNPLVYCGTVGIIRREHVEKAARPGDVIVAVGGRTGRDGIHGATFSSVELTEDSEMLSAGAVQIGNPIEEKRVLDGLLVARDEGLLTAVTDCGAAGFSSAVGEMGEETGARVYLERAPLKYDGLSYSEIWISEAQERMVFAVSPENVARVREIFEAEDVEVTELGEFTGDGRLRLSYEGHDVCDLPMEFMHDGLPRVAREAVWDGGEEGPFPWGDVQERPAADDLAAILGSWNVCSKEWVIRQYDHEVQGGSALKPLVGVRADGPGDATVCCPIAGNPRGVAVSSGLNPMLGDLSPYDMAVNAVDEALRNLTAVGADPRVAALLDNFSWGNASKPDRMGSLVLASEGLRDAALAYGTPFVSGKDSLNNEYQVGGRTIAVPPTLLVSAFGVVPDVTKLITMDLKAAGNHLMLVGLTRPQMGGSHFAHVRGLRGGIAPRVHLDEAGAVLDAVHRAISGGHVAACHDLSEGGAAAAVAEMAFAGCLGADVSLVNAPFEGEELRDEVLLFAESPSRFLCEVAPEHVEAFREALGDVPYAEVGRVTAQTRLRISGARARPLVDEDIERFREAFLAPLRDGASGGHGS